MQDLCLTKRESLPASTDLAKVELGKLPKGRKYRTKHCEVHIEDGAAGNVTVQILVGDSVLLPTEGVFTSDIGCSHSEARIDLPEGAELFVQRKNADATNPRTYCLVLDLEEVSA